MEAVIPFVVTALCVWGLFKKINIFDSFVEGAKEGMATVKFIAPTMIALLVAVGTLRASGVLDRLSELIQPLCERLGFPSELVPMALLRPVSGSGATALMTGIFEHSGPDSFAGRCASVVAGSTETTFYAVTMYYGAAGIRRIRHTLISALTADFTAVVVSVLTVGLLTGI